MYTRDLEKLGLKQLIREAAAILRKFQAEHDDRIHRSCPCPTCFDADAFLESLYPSDKPRIRNVRTKPRLPISPVYTKPLAVLVREAIAEKTSLSEILKRSPAPRTPA